MFMLTCVTKWKAPISIFLSILHKFLEEIEIKF